MYYCGSKNICKTRLNYYYDYYDLGLGIGIKDWGFGFGIWDWDWGLGIRDWGLRIGISN